jgi:hypothetical protein
MFLTLTLLAPLALAAPPSATADADTFFELKIRPILVDSCFKCHGGAKTSHGLRVDSREALLKGGTVGPAVVPGDPDKSPLIRAIRHASDELQMPPGKRLPDAVVADFTTWVAGGANWPRAVNAAAFRPEQHWAFRPVKVTEPPPDPDGWATTPIDRFIAAGLHREHLTPVRPADQQALIRRVTFDLTGLPPTPEDTDAFVNDSAPDAYARLVDRLLASPAYGERWGRHWLDVARYADTAGDNADYPVPEARLYRDYVIDSFNADKPYDQFVCEQLAGDILAKQGPSDRYAERVVATGFLALSRRYATAPYELWHLTLEDTIDTTGRAFLGLTLRCARCHDHKFDPVTQQDYYALYGFFASTQFPWAGGEELVSKNTNRQHFVPLLPPEQAAPRIAAYEKRLAALESEFQAEESKKEKKDKKRLGELRNELRRLGRPGLPSDLPSAYAVQDGTPTDVALQLRGEPDATGPVVRRDAPKFLRTAELPLPESGSGRLSLARWIASPVNPLTARVMANRVWQFHFGRGLVATPSNFGARGEPPTHPELLDYLADRFVRSGWSIKALHRDILVSKTYRLASTADPANSAMDPGNRWYWRRDRLRLDAEETRDALLSVAGRLDLHRPGPHPFPSPEQWTWTQHNAFKEVYASTHRSVYVMTQRLQRHPFLGLFDFPDTNTSTDQRTSSTVPPQALFLMNNPFVTEQAAAFARRVTVEAPDPDRWVERAVRLAWGRPATSAERERAVCYLDACRARLAEAGVSAERRDLEARTSYARVLFCSNEFVYLD